MYYNERYSLLPGHWQAAPEKGRGLVFKRDRLGGEGLSVNASS